MAEIEIKLQEEPSCQRGPSEEAPGRGTRRQGRRWRRPGVRETLGEGKEKFKTFTSRRGPSNQMEGPGGDRVRPRETDRKREGGGRAGGSASSH